MKQTDPQFKLRLPPALKQELEAQAERNDRPLGAEIVTRLQDSLHKVTIDGEKLQSLKREAEQYYHQAMAYKVMADYTDGVRATLAGQLLDMMALVPAEKWPPELNTRAAFDLARLLAQKDDRGAAFSLLQMVEKTDPEITKALRYIVESSDRAGISRLSQRLAKVRVAAASKAKNSSQDASSRSTSKKN